MSPAEEPQFGIDGCTCRPWTRQTDPPRYLDQPGDTVDMIGGWKRGDDCPHHKRGPAEEIRAAAETCPFCEIVAGRAPATIVHEWSDVIAFVPLNPVVAGHTLVVPKEHVTDFVDDPVVSAQTMYRAAELCDDFGSYNVITSRGREATQSVFHLHLHVVPRRADDGLALPWHSGRSKRRTAAPAVGEQPHA